MAEGRELAGMTDWDRIQSLFDDVAAKPLDQRAAALREACAADDELRAEVESLLEHDCQAGGGFLQPPELPPAIDESESREEAIRLVGSSIGRYHVKRLIASGGMGSVFEAVQEQPERLVALKVLRRHVASRSALRRFELESHILGHLRHPNIAHVHEAGIHEIAGVSVPYFAMEYIPGARNIIEFSNEKDLKTRDRLRLFAKVCDAIHHGHQKGIIHRDLKPNNILVDTGGEPKVIDFGVARATDSNLSVTTMQTEVGQIIGTLQYMSPEQCVADTVDIDTRSDIYSLGVVLYELLCNKLPYEISDTTIVRAVSVIREHEPQPPSIVDRRLRGDVETIVLKMLEKNRERRYTSAAELAADIRRFLNREPITAKPRTAWIRLAHWIVRRPIMATTVACLAIAALILSSAFVTAWLVDRRPYAIVAVRDPGLEDRTGMREARLVAATGRVLQEWRGKTTTALGVAELVQRPSELGGGRVIVLGAGVDADPPLRRALCVFNADGDLNDPIWQKRITTNEILPKLRENRGYTGDDFTFHYGWVFDVFPDKPGDEIVATFGHESNSQNVIRIYDLAGTRLYEVWHDGILGHCCWMKDAGLLVFAGDWHLPYYDENGDWKGGRSRDFVVFALRPKVDAVGKDWLRPPGDSDFDGRLAPEWFLFLRPAGIEERVYRYTLFPPRRLPEGQGISVGLFFDASDSLGIGWEINKSGGEVPESRVPGDGYDRNQQLPSTILGRLPGPNEVRLVPSE